MWKYAGIIQDLAAFFEHAYNTIRMCIIGGFTAVSQPLVTVAIQTSQQCTSQHFWLEGETHLDINKLLDKHKYHNANALTE